MRSRAGMRFSNWISAMSEWTDRTETPSKKPQRRWWTPLVRALRDRLDRVLGESDPEPVERNHGPTKAQEEASGVSAAVAEIVARREAENARVSRPDDYRSSNPPPEWLA